MQRFDKIAAVVVTHNRLELLKECLSAIKAQRRSPDIIFVVNNGSTDGTRDLLDQTPGITVIHQDNLGGAGGFFTGFKAAYEWGADGIWCMDDDTIPYPDTLAGLLFTAQAYVLTPRPKPLGWVGSVDNWSDGSIHVMNRPKLATGCDWLSDCRRLQAIPAYFSSYVSILFTREAVRVAGYPIREMYIWGDDVEHTLRVTGAGFEGLVSFASPCLHKTPKNASSTLKNLTKENLWKYLWHFRNFRTLDRRRWYLTKKRQYALSIETIFNTYRHLLLHRKFWAIIPISRAITRGLLSRLKATRPNLP